MKTKVLACLITLTLGCIYTVEGFADTEEAPDYTGLSCAELYRLATSMEPSTQRYRSPLYNEKTDSLATAIGTVTNLGYYYFGFTTVHSYMNEYRLHENLAELDTVRYLMARKFCFQKS